MTNVFLDAEMPDEERRSRLYQGDIFLYSPSPATMELVNLARRMLEECFAPNDPRTIHEVMDSEKVASILAVMKPQFIHHPDCKKIIPKIMSERGIDNAKLYFDVPRLRTAYPSHFLSTGIAYAFHPHRDTWYSAPMCQLNWWIPIFPLEPGNSMGFYHRYFSEPVKNGSHAYNYYEWNAKYRASAAQHVKNDTREQPKAQQELEPISVRYLVPPGGIIIFSGAQLHETVPNHTNIARYSIDFRTVFYDDLILKQGAPNLDARCTGTTMRDYLRATDLAHVPDEIVAMYDDETAERHSVHFFGDRLVHREAQ